MRPATVDVADHYALPLVRTSARVRAAYAEAVAARVRATNTLLDAAGINHTRVGSSDEVLTAVFALLERQRRASG